jgi:hypothetical protein
MTSLRSSHSQVEKTADKSLTTPRIHRFVRDMARLGPGVLWTGIRHCRGIGSHGRYVGVGPTTLPDASGN